MYAARHTNPTALESKALEQERFDATVDLLEHRYPGERFAVRKALAAVLKPRLRLPRATSTHKALLTPEVRAIRTREELPQSLKVKLVRNVCALHWLVMRDHPRVRNLPKDFDTACNLYVFRYALCAHIWTLEWVAEGSNAQSKRVRNDLVDLLVAVYGTYFDGVTTRDHKLAYVHSMARFMLETMRAERWAAT